MIGLQIRNKEILDDLQKTIKELEMKRIETDLLNTDKYADLYKICYRLLESLNN